MEDLVGTLEKRVEENDLVVFLTARQGTPPWTPELQSLPARLGSLADHSMTFLCLSDQDVVVPEVLTASASLGDHFFMRQIVSDLDAENEEIAVAQMLQTHFDGEGEEFQDVLDKLLREDASFTRELTNGVLLLNARSSSIQRTRIFVGISTNGIESPSHPNESIYGIFILLSPEDTSLQDHLEHFSELGELVTRITDIKALAAIERPTDLLEELRRLATEKEATFPREDEVKDLKSLQDIEV